jgi:hypothetical protein
MLKKPRLYLARCIDELEAFCIDRSWLALARFLGHAGVFAWGIRVEDGKVDVGLYKFS